MITNEKYVKHSSRVNTEIYKQDNPLWQRQGFLFSRPKINIVLKILTCEIRQIKEIKDISIGKEEVKLSFIGENIIAFVGMNVEKKLPE